MTVWARLALALIATVCAAPAGAAEYYVGPNGTSAGSGSQNAPWDIESALGGGKKIVPGDTIFLLGGTYKHPNRKVGNLGYTVRLAGSETEPIHVRAAEGQRVTIDGGLMVSDPSAYAWLWDLEILVSENLTKSRRFEEPGSHPKSYDRPPGGLNIYGGKGCKYINLVIHDNAGGVSFWSGATDSEVYGCIIYDNGWDAPDRGHGHAIYTQNEKGTKFISDCIMTGGYGYSMHAYGSSRAFVNGYRMAGNICYDAGPFLIGGGRPSRDIAVVDNYLYNLSMQIGYSAPYNENCEVRGNVIVNGGLTIKDYKSVVNEGNILLGEKDPRPKDAPVRTEIRPNRYDPDRSHVVVFNWERRPRVELDLGQQLQIGDRFLLFNPRSVSGKPVGSGTYDGKPVSVHAGDEFAAFLLVRYPRDSDTP